VCVTYSSFVWVDRSPGGSASMHAMCIND